MTEIDIKTKLLTGCSLADHITFQTEYYNQYLSNLFLLFYEYNIDFSINDLAKILVASLIKNNKEFSTYLLKDPRYDLPVILKCCDILDSKRLHTQLEKKTNKIKNLKKLTKHKALISNLKTLNEGIDMSLSSSKIKFIKNHWVKNLSEEKLELMALVYPTKHWKWIIDMMHLKPTDFKLEWFTKYIFTKEYPKNSIIDICTSLNNENIKETITKYKIPFDYLKLTNPKLLSQDVKNTIFAYTPVADVIRYWDDFGNSELLQPMHDRIIKGEELNMPYGELMKRIQMLKEKLGNSQFIYKLIDIAESKLSTYKLSVEQPIVVLGDASGSMEVAIKTSSIITSILVKLCNAKMHLFRDKDQIVQNPPKNVSDVLNMMEIFKAHSSTSPAASLYPYYERKEIVKTFILVTDEEENGTCNGKDFTGIFKLYREEVYPAKLVFVSFLRNNKDGYMVSKLKNAIPGIERDIIQFILNGKNPDLRKLDELLNMLSIDSEYYDVKYAQINNNLVNGKMILSQMNKNKIIDILCDKSTIEIDDTPIIISI